MRSIKNIVKDQIGWVYPDLRWFTEKGAKLAIKKRDALYASLSKEVRYSFMRNKIHTGSLSPGCQICGDGYWACLYISSLCTANCFFCTQDRTVKKESIMQDDFSVFKNHSTLINYIQRFHFKGVSFSGGECFLVFDKLLLYVRKIKEEFGKKIYLWIYTNGDLVNEDKLLKLKKAGLDEIRFNISARNYDVRPVALAAKIINAVTVEIPAIPEDFEMVKKCLPKLEKIGVKKLNLHQLMATDCNYKNFVKRGYTFIHSPCIPIFESEITALQLMRYALDKKINLPINYCSEAYKRRRQKRGDRRWLAPLVKDHCEELTDNKFIRSLSIQDSPANIQKIIKILQNNRCQRRLWRLKNTQNELFIHSALLKYIDFKRHGLTITYFIPQAKRDFIPGEIARTVTINAEYKIFVTKGVMSQVTLSSRAAIQCFQNLFINNMAEEEVLLSLSSNYGLTFSKAQAEAKRLLSLKQFERGMSGLPHIC